MVEKVSGISKRTNLLFVLAIAGFALCTLAAPVSSETVEEGPLKRNGWEISVVPYAWMPSIDGSITFRGQTEDVSVDTYEIVDELLKSFQVGVMIDLEVRKDRVGMFVSPFYVDLRADKNKTILPGRILETDIKADVSMKMFIMDFGVTYRLGPYGLRKRLGSGTPRVTVEPYIGGRWTDIDAKLDVTILKTRSFDGGAGWADPMLGARTLWELNPHWRILVSGNVGGFGVGSDLAWSVTGLVGWRFHFSKRIMGNVVWGYRALYQDNEVGIGADRLEFDANMHGPLVGLAIGFGQWPLIK